MTLQECRDKIAKLFPDASVFVTVVAKLYRHDPPMQTNRQTTYEVWISDHNKPSDSAYDLPTLDACLEWAKMQLPPQNDPVEIGAGQ